MNKEKLRKMAESSCIREAGGQKIWDSINSSYQEAFIATWMEAFKSGRELLKKYMGHVINCEGYAFLRELNDVVHPDLDIEFTDDEIQQLHKLEKELRGKLDGD